ncbi:MAG: peptidylprolyl isomerase [Verrucomicrobiota bacterium]
MKRILKEPLLHFVLLGTGLFLVYGLIPKEVGRGDAGRIVVTQGQIEHLTAGFIRTWHRPPTAEELAGLVRDDVEEEIYYREAMAMELDKDDTVIRRRLRQKLQFVSEDIAAQAEPTEAELSAYLQAHASTFRLPPRFTFRQVYLSPQKHRDNLAGDAAQLLVRLNQAGSEADATALGDALMLDDRYIAASASEVSSQFGAKFAEQLAALTPGQWQGPVDSGYGVHLVLVTERSDGRLPALGEIRDAVRREWASARRLEANQKFYEELFKRYTVIIEPPKVSKGGRK